MTTALLLVDVINDLNFVGGEALLRFALPMAKKTAALKTRARASGAPVIYVNDNFGRWRSDFKMLVKNAMQKRGAPVAALLRPDEEDYFVLKPKHSGFYASPLHLLLQSLEVKRLVVCGLAGENCVMATASEAYQRGYDVVVPRDCTASESKALNDKALAHMRRVFKADTRTSRSVRFSAKRR